MKSQYLIALLFAAGAAWAQPGGQQGGQQAPTAAELIAKLDADGDGKISESEFDGPAEHFAQFDADGDGYLTTSEIPSGPPNGQQGGQGMQQGMQGGQGMQQGMQGGQGMQGRGQETGAAFVARLDTDSDGKVSSTEFDGPSDLFTTLDKDGDGYLSESEAPTGPPQGQGGRR